MKVGIGPGSDLHNTHGRGRRVCRRLLPWTLWPTRSMLRASASLLTAVSDSGDIVKALAAGADCVTLGGLFARTEEAPGVVLNQGLLQVVSRHGFAGRWAQAGSVRTVTRHRERRRKARPGRHQGRVPYKGPSRPLFTSSRVASAQAWVIAAVRRFAELHAAQSSYKITGAGIRESRP